MNSDLPPRSAWQTRWWVVTAALIALTIAVTWWAARVTIIQPVATDGTGERTVTATVVEGTVGRRIGIGVTLRQPFEVVATNSLPGIVTAVHDTSSIAVGDPVFEVGAIPVRVVSGQVPFHRDLDHGARGRDVEQLQDALVELGHLAGDSDGIFGSATAAAVRNWQAELGIELTGVVRLGEVLAVENLQGGIRLGESVLRGRLIAGGESAILAHTGAQDFTAVLSNEQATVVSAEVPLHVFFEDLVWEARSVGSRVDENGWTVLELAALDGGPLCGAECGRLPSDEHIVLRAEAVVTPEATGPVVPAAAVRQSPDGQTYIQLEDGTRRDVEVLASSQGLAVVQGVEIGAVVLVLDDLET